MWSSISRLFVVFVGTESREEWGEVVVSKKQCRTITILSSIHRGNIVVFLSCFQTSCTMDQNLARLQNPHRFLRENRFLEGEDPSKGLFYNRGESLKRNKLMNALSLPLEGCYSWRVIPARRPVPTSAQSPGLAIPSTSRAIPAPIGTRSVTDQGICSSPSWTHPRASPTRLS